VSIIEKSRDHLNAACLGKLDGIADEIDQNLP
jgi:hypothetical protein